MLSDILKSLRTKNKYTQQNIADFLVIERSTYSYYETGKTEPSSTILAKLSRLYHVGLDELIPFSYNSNSSLELECTKPKSINISEKTEVFSSLSYEEQQLIMHFRACSDKRKFFDAIKDIIEVK